MRTILIDTIPHKDQNYDTAGNYGEVKLGHVTWFTISNMNNWRYEAAVALHEQYEYFLCKRDGVNLKSIDRFDEAYEKARVAKTKAPCGCKPTKASEPGNDIHAPYHFQHVAATKMERKFIFDIGEDWNEYDEKVNSL
jgi:hypothetical protein